MFFERKDSFSAVTIYNVSVDQIKFSFLVIDIIYFPLDAINYLNISWTSPEWLPNSQCIMEINVENKESLRVILKWVQIWIACGDFSSRKFEPG